MLLKKKWYVRALTAGVLVLSSAIAVPLIEAGAAGGTDVNNAGVFELDGNVVHTAHTMPPYDWATLFTATGNRVAQPGLIDSVFIADQTATNDFAVTQNTKDIANLTTWNCKVTSVTPKDELQNAYAAAFVAPAASPVHTHLLLYMALERGSVTGTSNAGFWLLKNNVACDTNSTTANFGKFVTGSTPKKLAKHATNDKFLFASFTSGGTSVTIQLYSWSKTCTGSNKQPKNCASGSTTGGLLKGTTAQNGSQCSVSDVNLCGVSNATASITTPWAPKSVGTNGFFEAGVDLTAEFGNTFLKTNGCFSTFAADTRASGASVGNESHDFALKSFHLCGSPTLKTTQSPKTGTVGQLKPSDTATLSTFTGSVKTETVTFKLFSNSTCTGTPLFTGTAKLNATGKATISDTTALTKTGTDYWVAFYKGDTLNQAATSGCKAEPVTVKKATPKISTTAGTESPSPGIVGSPVTTSDTATLSTAFKATGTVTFQLLPPGGTSTACGSPAVTLTLKKGVTPSTKGTSVTIPVTNTQARTTSVYAVTFTPTAVGTYHWVAKYGGDTNNKPATELGCTASGEKVPVAKATPTLKTIMFLGDIANVTKGDSPAGTIIFKLYNGASCTGTIVFTYSINLSGGTANTLASLATKLSTAKLANGKTYSWTVTYKDTSGLNNTVSSCTESTGTISSP